LPRRLGQHFLTSNSILTRIAEATCGDHAQRVIEIGPGRGALTRHLLPRTDELHAIELDRELVRLLDAEFQENGKVRVHHSDVLATDLSQWGPATIAGNLPYYITSPIMERFLRLGDGFPRAVFLIQEEVADRLRASPGSRAYGFLTVQTQMFCRVEPICRVPPGAFSPPPQVYSAVVRLERKAIMDETTAPLLEFIGKCFAHKRKTLRNNLKPYYPSAMLDALPEASLRAEQLTISQFVDIHQRLIISRG
jgi:16S rRNA (adenine1518-N6/adenine1519-N6)-dimethyltransferase